MCCMRSIGDRAVDEGTDANVVLKMFEFIQRKRTEARTVASDEAE